MSTDPNKPNILLILADNLGWGLLLHNFNVESDCVPTRSALMTGWHPIRTGCLQSVPAGFPQGLTTWEKTLPELLRENGYHLGDIPGRYPSDRGFDEWYGIPRTTDESQFTSSIGFEADVVEMPYIMDGKTGSPSRNVCVYDLNVRRAIDATLVEKSTAWLTRQTNEQTPFLYHPMVHLHFPTLPHVDFVGSSKHGGFADSVAEMDFRTDQVLDHLDSLGPDIAANTVVIFASDNGPEFRPPYKGTVGPWSGTYHTAMEGGLRVPFIIRWPGHVPEGTTSNQIVHATDIFSAIAAITKTPVPVDRPIDGIDQTRLLVDPENSKSPREGFLFYIKNELRAIKWRDWKLHLVWEPH
ncbi:hypothetical protein Sste5346_010301 [Sporothrix stenoceras]|uniref:Sulfatase N-terminal domain-containing protein n=1 Tax=Sporothrix stenoceras TaxID=5173 RepID=A0ABR3YG73_9PEZI